MHRLGRAKGFTLVELLIVIIIIAVLAAVAIPRFQDATRRAKESAVKEHLRYLRNAIGTFHEDTNRWPLSINDLVGTTAPTNGYSNGGSTVPLNGSSYRGPYLTGQAIPGDMAGWIQYFPLDGDGKPRGTIKCIRAGNALNGKPYSSW